MRACLVYECIISVKAWTTNLFFYDCKCAILCPVIRSRKLCLDFLSLLVFILLSKKKHNDNKTKYKSYNLGHILRPLLIDNAIYCHWCSNKIYDLMTLDDTLGLCFLSYKQVLSVLVHVYAPHNQIKIRSCSFFTA